jgi:hypothetical protein
MGPQREAALRGQMERCAEQPEEDRMHLFVCTSNAMQLDRAIYNYKNIPLDMVIIDFIKLRQQIQYLS